MPRFSFRNWLTKFFLLLIILAISTFPLSLKAQVAKTDSISHKDLRPARDEVPRFDVRMLRRPGKSKSTLEQKNSNSRLSRK